MQKVNLPGCPWAALSPFPGVPPPILLSTNRRARPVVALLRHPCPSTLQPELYPSSPAAGPLTTMSGVTGLVVACIGSRLNSGWHTAPPAASTTEKQRGSQPAITAFTAIFSTVASPILGGM